MPTYKVVNGEVKAFGRFPTEASAALRESIRKWEWLSEYVRTHRTRDIPEAKSDSCSLCSIYLNGEGSCKNCPVFKKTNAKLCEMTPWILYENSLMRKLRIEALIAAQAEVLFLESLLPKRSGH